MTTMPINKSTFTATVYLPGEGFPLEVKSADVTLDETRAPYVQAEITCALPDQTTLELIDPRDALRVTVTATQEWIQPVRDPQTRTFDLLLHERTIDHEEAELTLQLVSDEALLIDAGNDTTGPTRIFGLSVKDAVVAKLTGHSFALEAGALDATLEVNPPTLPVITNRATNPSAKVNATGYTQIPGTSGAVSGARQTSGGLDGGAFYRATQTVASVDGFAVQYDAPGTQVYGTRYTSSCWVRTNADRIIKLRIAHYTPGVAVYANLYSDQVVVLANTWTRLSIKTTAPSTPGTHIAVIPTVVGATAISGTLDIDNIIVTEGTEVLDYFDGDTTDTGLDTFAWAGTANASASTRTNLLNSDVFIQTPGTLDWDYVAPLVQAGGLRLFCDEKRDWRLIDPLTYSVPGQINVAAGTNATSGRDTISRQQEDWFDAVVIEYRWTDDEGLPKVAYDSASAGGTKLLKRVVERPFPGAGAAQSILSLYLGRGRTVDVEALADLTTTPGMALVMSLPGTPIQVGVVSSVTWKWSVDGDSDEMRVGSRGLLDTPSTAWILQPEGYAWQDIPLGQSWPEYETPS
ncbi:MAG: hypothetical protein ACOH1M_03970 [Rhodoglobus sp.]